MKKLLVLSVGLALAASSGAAFAQTHTLSREDNIWGGYAHQPTEAQVTQQEQSAHVALPRQREQAINNDVDTLYRSLMRETSPTR